MRLFTALLNFLALASFPTASAAVWNDKLKVWNIGRVATTTTNHGKYRTWPVRDAGAGSPSSAMSAARSKTEASWPCEPFTFAKKVD